MIQYEKRPTTRSVTQTLTGNLAQPKWEKQRPEYEWQDFAACRGMDTDMFFPDYERDDKGQFISDKKRAQAAKRVCGGCLVRGQCLQEALANDEEYGVWGGTTPMEREAMKS